MDDPLPATQQFLKKQALDALHRCGNIRENMCDDVVGEFAYTLEDEFGHTAHAPMRAPFKTQGGTANHFVALIPADETAFASGPGYVLIDPTVKQFDDRVDDDLPEVAVLPPGDTCQSRWYASVESP